YWANRAIGFLANVEAVYFSEQDREVYNPYLGKHPPYRMIDSLRYQLYASVTIALLVIAYFINEVVARAAGGLWTHLRKTDFMIIMLWSLPFLVIVAFSSILAHTQTGRINGYLDFVLKSPGPGLVKRRESARGAALAGQLKPADLIPGPDVQSELLAELHAA